jgi:hypothetical protein
VTIQDDLFQFARRQAIRQVFKAVNLSECALRVAAEHQSLSGAFDLTPTILRANHNGDCQLAQNECVMGPLSRGAIRRRMQHRKKVNHLVRTSKQKDRNGQAECLCGLQADDQFDLDCLLDWHFRGFFAPENSGNSRLKQRLAQYSPLILDVGRAIIKCKRKIAADTANLAHLHYPKDEMLSVLKFWNIELS